VNVEWYGEQGAVHSLEQCGTATRKSTKLIAVQQFTIHNPCVLL